VSILSSAYILKLVSIPLTLLTEQKEQKIHFQSILFCISSGNAQKETSVPLFTKKCPILHFSSANSLPMVIVEIQKGRTPLSLNALNIHTLWITSQAYFQLSKAIIIEYSHLMFEC
jgi:hypothetical protein